MGDLTSPPYVRLFVSVMLCCKPPAKVDGIHRGATFGDEIDG